MTKREIIEERIESEERAFGVQVGKNHLRLKILKEALSEEIERKEDEEVAIVAEALRRAGLTVDNLPEDVLGDCDDLRITIAYRLLHNNDIQFVGMP